MELKNVRKDDELWGEVKRWKKNKETPTTARNRLKKLFFAVSYVYARFNAVLMHFQFGPVVLVDPLFNPRYMQTKNSANWQALQQLKDRLPGLENLTIIQPAIEHAILCIVYAIAGQDVATYVNEFLCEHEVQIEIERYPGFDIFL